MQWVGSVYSDDANLEKRPDFAVVNLGLSYDVTEKSEIALRAFNVFDEVYATGASDTQWQLAAAVGRDQLPHQILMDGIGPDIGAARGFCEPRAAPIKQGKWWLFWVHRWLGVVTCVLSVMWFLSGLVMLYVPFPVLERRGAACGVAADCSRAGRNNAGQRIGCRKGYISPVDLSIGDACG